MNAIENAKPSTVTSYVIGFLFSIALTLIPYKLVVSHVWERDQTITAIVICAVLQLLVQLKFFLHLNFSSKGRENLYSFIFTVITLFIIVAGSLWIMHDLNYYMMDPVMEQHHQMMQK